MKKLNTIQKREKLNDVYVMDEKGNGGAHHRYKIHREMVTDGMIPEVTSIPVYHEIQFQDGPRDTEDSTPGILDTDLLEIVRHRLECFQDGEFATMENDIALYHIETALLWLNKRVEDRIERNVLGTTNK